MKRRLTVIILVILFTIVFPAWITYRVMTRETANFELINAIQNDDTKAAIVALREGADANARESEADAPLSFSNQLRRFWNRFLHSRTVPDEHPTALIIACDQQSKDDPTLIKALLDAGADVNATGSIDSSSTSPLRTLLIHHSNATRCVQLLLAHGANVNYRSPDGETLLHIAANSDLETALPILLDAGADIEAKDNYGETPLFTACNSENLATIEVLLHHHANIHTRNRNGLTLLDALERYIALQEQTLKVTPHMNRSNISVRKRTLQQRILKAQALYRLLRQAGARTGKELDAPAVRPAKP